MSSSIAAAMNADPICRQIVLFLLDNEAAMDTAKGIAAWWVRCDEVAAQAALDRLIACGVVATHTLTSGTLYGLTRDQDLRSRLRATYGQEPEPRTPSFRNGRPLLSH